jgi:hypothetical protein
MLVNLSATQETRVWEVWQKFWSLQMQILPVCYFIWFFAELHFSFDYIYFVALIGNKISSSNEKVK